MDDIRDELHDDLDSLCATEAGVLEEILAKKKQSASANCGPKNQAEADAQLFATLCDIDKFNYLYLFERCKAFHIKSRQLRYLESEHIRRIIPSEQAGILAEFEQLHHLWKQKCLTALTPASSSNLPTKTVVLESINTNIIPPADIVSTELTSDEFIYSSSEESSGADYCHSDSQLKTTKFPLDDIIKDEMQEIRKQYKKYGTLTERNRRLLAKVIVCYFLNNNIYFKKDIMDNIADQIVAEFPTESKLAWHDMRTTQRRGRLCLKMYNMQRTKNSHLKRHRQMEEEMMQQASPSTDSDADATVS